MFNRIHSRIIVSALMLGLVSIYSISFSREINLRKLEFNQADYSGYQSRISTSWACYPKATHALSLTSIDQVNQAVSDGLTYDVREKRINEAVAEFKKAINCDPYGHRYWIRLAKLEALLVFNLSELTEKLIFIRSLAPYQKLEHEDRIAELLSMPGKELLVENELVREDFGRYLDNFSKNRPYYPGVEELLTAN